MKLKNTLQVRCAPEAARAIATIAIIFMIDFSAKHFFLFIKKQQEKANTWQIFLKTLNCQLILNLIHNLLNSCDDCH